MRFITFCFFVVVWGLPFYAVADAPAKSLGVFAGWKTFHYKEGGQNVCYMLLRPAKKEFKGKRGDSFLTITLRPAESPNPVVNMVAGYHFNIGSEVTLRVDKENFLLFTQGDGAWARSSAIDIKITNAIRTGKAMAAAGVATKGGKSLDGFVLAGADKAYKAIRVACGL